MKNTFVYHHLLFVCIVLASSFVHARSPFRKPERELPEISTRWTGGTQTYTLKDSHLEEYPLFAFHERDLAGYLLPEGKITYRNDSTQSVQGAELSALIEHIVSEVREGKKKFTHFTLLQKKNFSRKQCCGLIVLKCKHHPFVLKLFIETPQTFAGPYGKGIEPICFFYMGGGANRHLTGLTRIKNATLVNSHISKLPHWNTIVETPRKWFWLPKNNRMIEITGKNICNKKEMHTRLPAVYGVVADAIETKKEIPIPIQQKKKMVMSLCNDLEMKIDPHYNNFIFLEDGTKTGFKIVIVDTEHFPTIVGLKKKKRFRNHNSWYQYLAAKCFGDTYLRTKQRRRKEQTNRSKLALT